MSNFRSNNHYVPKLYLKRWASDGLKVPTYRLLVPHDEYPVWKKESLSSLPAHLHLYTRLNEGVESDDMERWFDQEFESPAESALQKVEKGLRLSPLDWKTLVRFLALQDVRTPARMMETLSRLDDDLPDLLKATLEDAVVESQAAFNAGRKMLIPAAGTPSLIPIAVRTEIEPGAEFGKLGVETVVGRGLWLHVIKHLLTNTINVLAEHRWTILHPPVGLQWPTSDNPVVRLNYHSPSQYDFRGGWGSKGTEIMLPLSPYHLFYTFIGSKPPQNGSRVSISVANAFRKVILENAHRYVFAQSEDDALPHIRTRFVDAQAVEHERREWEEFHDRNVRAEMELFKR